MKDVEFVLKRGIIKFLSDAKLLLRNMFLQESILKLMNYAFYLNAVQYTSNWNKF